MNITIGLYTAFDYGCYQISRSPTPDRLSYPLSGGTGRSVDVLLSRMLSLSHTHSLCLSFTHTLTRSVSISLPRTHSLCLSLTHTYSLSLSLPLSHSLALSLSPSLTLNRYVSLSHTHSHSLCLSLPLSHSLALSLFHTLTRSLSLSGQARNVEARLEEATAIHHSSLISSSLHSQVTLKPGMV